MSIEAVIDSFCPQCFASREQIENIETPFNPDCSRCSQRSQYMNKRKLNDLNAFVTKCCRGLKTCPDDVLARFLSEDDKHDIINGDIPEPCLRAHIDAWVQQGSPFYATKL